MMNKENVPFVTTLQTIVMIKSGIVGMISLRQETKVTKNNRILIRNYIEEII